LRRALARATAGERRASARAEHDSLTDLPNREGFDRRLNGALSGVSSGLRNGDRRGAGAAPLALAVLYLDLDDFKRVNDSHGHAVGDALLRAVGQRLRGAMRASDTVCRLGGDEFACLLDGPASRDELAALAAQLIATVAAPLQLGALNFSVRLSVGIALCPDHGRSAAELLHSADAAMFEAKRERSGLAFFNGPGVLPS
jgi:diguanylate cyclase